MIHSVEKCCLRLAIALLCCCFRASAAPEADEQCTKSAVTWGDACAGPSNTAVVENATAWWYENIEPFIPEDEKQYYQEPFGGATQPSMYLPELRKQLLTKVNDQGVKYSHLKGGRPVGHRAPLHRHDYGATTHVLQGYITLFLEGIAPVTYGPGESYYMPPGGKVMTASVMAKPVYEGNPIEQPFNFSENIDTNAFPDSTMGRGTVFMEREIILDGEDFYWVSGVGAYSLCPVPPRSACQTDGYVYNRTSVGSNVEQAAANNVASESELSSSSGLARSATFGAMMALLGGLAVVVL